MRSKDGFQEAQAEFRQTFGERLSQLLSRYPSRQAASDVAGVNPDQFPKYISGRAKPSFEAIAKLATVCGISLDWLAYGVGGNDFDGLSKLAVIDISENGNRRSKSPKDIVTAKLWGDAPDNNFRAVFAADRMNEPEIFEGDILILDISQTKIADAGFYLFVRDGAYLLRWAQFDLRGGFALKGSPTADSSLLLTKDELSEVQVVGRVRWRIGAV